MNRALQTQKKKATFNHIGQTSVHTLMALKLFLFQFNSVTLFHLFTKTIWWTMLRDQRILPSIFDLWLGIKLIISITLCLYDISSLHLSIISCEKFLVNKFVSSFKNKYVTKMEKGPKRNFVEHWKFCSAFIASQLVQLLFHNLYLLQLFGISIQRADRSNYITAKCLSLLNQQTFTISKWS